jgi:hypothetical protein
MESALNLTLRYPGGERRTYRRIEPAIAAWMPVPCVHVDHIVRLGAHVQVGWIYASPLIAGVTDKLSRPVP